MKLTATIWYRPNISTDLFSRVTKQESEKTFNLLLCLRKVTTAQKRKRRFPTKRRNVRKSTHLLDETSCPWDHAQAHPPHVLTNARLQECFKRRHSKLAQLLCYRTTANLLQCSVQTWVLTHNQIFGTSSCPKCETRLSRRVSKPSPKALPEGHFDNKSTNICSTMRCKIQSCHEILGVQKSDQRASHIRFTVRCKFGLDL